MLLNKREKKYRNLKKNNDLKYTITIWSDYVMNNQTHWVSTGPIESWPPTDCQEVQGEAKENGGNSCWLNHRRPPTGKSKPAPREWHNSCSICGSYFSYLAPWEIGNWLPWWWGEAGAVIWHSCSVSCFSSTSHHDITCRRNGGGYITP